ncbi:MAG TPA: hypothetical protein VJI66_02225 [Candidatus Paceibacterota bacterium]
MAHTIGSAGNREERHLFKFGPNCSGKGYGIDKLKKVYGHRIWIVAMGDLVRARLKDQKNDWFRRRFGKIVADRKLLPDDVMMSMARDRYEEGIFEGRRFFAWDGVGRNSDQIATLIGWGVLTPANARALVLMASKDICRLRHDHRSALKPDGHRTDTHKFEEGYEVYLKNMPGVIDALHESGNTPHFINANNDLDQVADAVLAQARQMWPVHRQEAKPDVANSHPLNGRIVYDARSISMAWKLNEQSFTS